MVQERCSDNANQKQREREELGTRHPPRHPPTDRLPTVTMQSSVQIINPLTHQMDQSTAEATALVI